MHRSDAAVFSTAASTGTVARKRSAHCKAIVAKIAPDGVSAGAGDHLSDARLELATGATPGSVGRSDLLDGSASTPPRNHIEHTIHIVVGQLDCDSFVSIGPIILDQRELYGARAEFALIDVRGCYAESAK